MLDLVYLKNTNSVIVHCWMLQILCTVYVFFSFEKNGFFFSGLHGFNDLLAYFVL